MTSILMMKKKMKQKLKQSMANIRGDDDSSQMRLSFEHLNEAYATVREILCELKKKRKENLSFTRGYEAILFILIFYQFS